MARRVIGLDLGAYSVKLVRLECGKQGSQFEILDQEEEILLVDDKDEPDLIEQQKDAVSKLFQKGILEAETFAIGLDAIYGQMRTMKVPFVENRKIEAVLPGLLESEVPFEIDDMIVTWHRIEEAKKAALLGSETEGADIRIAFGKKPAIARTLHMLQAFAIDPRQMLLSSAAPYELVRELGYQLFSSETVSSEAAPAEAGALSAIIDFGHRHTSLCIFDRVGIKFTRSFLRGGKTLTEDIAKALEIPFVDAEKLKHEKLNFSESSHDEQEKILDRVAKAHYRALFDEISRTLIAAKTGGIGDVRSVAIIGGASKAENFSDYFAASFSDQRIVSIESLFGRPISPSMAMAFILALSCLQIHAKDNRFNFRKDEFAWRGELDFLRSKSGPLILWGLILICSLTILWSASSLVLEKENSSLEARLKAACTQILGQKNVTPAKCLALMKEQISSTTDVGVPESTASDIYLKTAEYLPKDLKVTFSELDVSEKKVRIAAETPSFEDVDKVVANLSKIPCFVNVEKGRAQQTDSLVKFTLTSDFDCSLSASKKPKP